MSKYQIPNGVKHIENAAEQGNGHACWVLGQRFLIGNEVEQAYEIAVKWFKRGSKLGSNRAMHSLAELRLKNQISDAELSICDAYELLRTASSHGCETSQSELAFAILNNRFPWCDIADAKYWLELASLNGDQRSQRMIYWLKYNNNIEPMFVNEVLDRMTRQALGGDSKVMADLGIIMILASGSEVLIQKGHQWLEQALQTGDSATIETYAEYYLLRGNTEQQAKAFKIALEAASGDCDKSKYLVGMAYCQGLGCTMDLIAGLNWLKIVRNDYGMQFQYNLGLSMLLANDDTVDEKRGLKILWTLSDQGLYDAKYVLSQLPNLGKPIACHAAIHDIQEELASLGISSVRYQIIDRLNHQLFEDGDPAGLVTINLNFWLQCGVDEQDSWCQWRLAESLLHTKGFSNNAEAIALLECASSQGFGKADFRLGFMYGFGQSEFYNPSEAIKRFEKEGSHEALWNISVLYSRSTHRGCHDDRATFWRLQSLNFPEERLQYDQDTSYPREKVCGVVDLNAFRHKKRKSG